MNPLRILWLALLLLFCAANTDGQTPYGWVVAGNYTIGSSGDGGPATSAQLNSPYGIALDNAGNMFISDQPSQVIRKVDASGTISTYIGLVGTYGYSGDGGPASAAQINTPGCMAFDKPGGNLYFADQGLSVIRKVDANGVITTYAGTGGAASFYGSTADGSLASTVALGSVGGMVTDNEGDLYFSDQGLNAVWMIDPQGYLHLVVPQSNGGFSGDGGAATSATVGMPRGLGVDASGNLYISDNTNGRVREVNHATGIITTIAGYAPNGLYSSGDGGPATAAVFGIINGIVFDASGDLYMLDWDFGNIRMIDPTGIISTYAGVFGYDPNDGLPATSDAMNSPDGLSIDGSGSLYVADAGFHVVQKISQCQSSYFTLALPSYMSICDSAVIDTDFVVHVPGAESFAWQVDTAAADFGWRGYWKGLQGRTDYSGVSTDSLGIPPIANITSSYYYDYRCVVRTACGNMISEYSSLIIQPPSRPLIQIGASDVSAGINPDTICMGTNVTFTATASGQGNSPTYTWLLNGNDVSTNSLSYTSSGLSNGDKVWCLLKGSDACTTTASSDTLSMVVYPSVVASVIVSATNDTICTGVPITFSATVANGGTQPLYQWEVNGVDVGSGSDTFTTANLLNGDVVQCLLTSNAYCVPSAQAYSTPDPILVYPSTTTGVQVLSADTPVCAGSPVTFSAQVNGGSSGSQEQWLLNDLPVATNTLTYTDAAPNNGDKIRFLVTDNEVCVSDPQDTSEATTISVIPIEDASINISSPDSVICARQPMTFTANPSYGGNSPVLQWELNGNNVGTGSSNYTVSNLSNGDIISCLLLSNQACAVPARPSNAIDMTVLPVPTVAFVPDTLTIQGQSISLVPAVQGNIDQYSWMPQVGLDNPSAQDPTCTIDQPTTYRLTVFSPGGCSDSASVTVIMANPLDIPSAFTPNGDGLNDVFRIPAGAPITLEEFTVYNRWGSIVFRTEDALQGWDGLINGSPAQQGVYVYLIRGKDLIKGGKIALKGTVTLIR